MSSSRGRYYREFGRDISVAAKAASITVALIVVLLCAAVLAYMAWWTFVFITTNPT